MKRLFFIVTVITLAILVIVTSGCSSSPSKKAFPVTIGEFTFKSSPQRVVVLSPGLTQTVYTLGYGGRVVGVINGLKSPSPTATMAKVGDWLLPNAESILALSPQVVLATTPPPLHVQYAIAAAKVPLLIIPPADTTDGVYENYALICKLFEGEEKAALRLKQMKYAGDTMLAHTSAQVQSALEAMESTAPIQALWIPMPPYDVSTRETLMSEWLNNAGFYNSAQPYFGWAIEPEDAVNIFPDYIFYGGLADEGKLPTVFAHTTAVKEGRLIHFNALPFESLTPVMFLDFYNIMKSTFPESFTTPMPSIDMAVPKVEPVKKSWLDNLLGK